jgi:hypothetical protein
VMIPPFKFNLFDAVVANIVVWGLAAAGITVRSIFGNISVWEIIGWAAIVVGLFLLFSPTVALLTIIAIILLKLTYGERTDGRQS